MADQALQGILDEHREVYKRLFRVATVVLTILFIAVVGLGRAFDRIDTREVGKLLKGMCCGGRANQEELSYVFVPTCREMSRRDCDETVSEAEDGSTGEAGPGDLESLARTWFTLNVSLLAFDVDLDLRYWIIGLPLLLWMSSSYLAITFAKLAVLSRLGNHLVGKARSGESPIENLYFQDGANSPYLRYPSRIASRGYVVAVMAMLGYLGFVGAPFWTLLNGKMSSVAFGLQASWVCLATLVSYYVAAYTKHACIRIDEAAAAISRESRQRSIAERIYDRLTDFGKRKAGAPGRNPRVSVGIGSALIIISLFMTFATSCGGSTRKGYQLFQAKSEAAWFTAPTEVLNFPESVVPDLGRRSYATMLLVAFVALVLIGLSLFVKVLPWSKTGQWLRVPFTVVSLFMLVEAAFVYPLVSPYVNDVVRIVYFVIPVSLWISFGLSRKEDRIQRWREHVRPFLVVVLLPAVILVPIAIARLCWVGVWGVPVLFAGLQIAALACIGPRVDDRKY